jgi:hypothetical protein
LPKSTATINAQIAQLCHFERSRGISYISGIASSKRCFDYAHDKKPIRATRP